MSGLWTLCKTENVLSVGRFIELSIKCQRCYSIVGPCHISKLTNDINVLCEANEKLMCQRTNWNTLMHDKPIEGF